MAQIKKLKLNGKTIYPVTHPKAVIDPSSGRSITATVTQSANGLMSAADKKKLDNIAAGANNYSLPAATASVLGGVKLGSDTVQSAAANAVSATANRTYAVQKNTSGQMVVNIPWGNSIAIKGGDIDANNVSPVNSLESTFFWGGSKNTPYGQRTFVLNMGFNEFICQLAIEAGSGLLFTRTYDGSTWSKWNKFGSTVMTTSLVSDITAEAMPQNETVEEYDSGKSSDNVSLKTAYLEKKNTDLEARILKLESLVANLTQPETEV